MDQMTGGASKIFSTDENLPIRSSFEAFENEMQTSLQALNELQATSSQAEVIPEADKGVLSSAVLSDSINISGIRTISSPPESAGGQ